MAKGRPAKPLEQKRKLGNPGQRRLPEVSETIALVGGYIEPPRPLEFAGMQLWDMVFKHGGTWISQNTDTQLLLMTCEQLDRREELRSAIAEKGLDRQLIMSINETEKLISSNLGLLGFSPADRTRLGLAEVKTQSKLQELMAKKNAG